MTERSKMMIRIMALNMLTSSIVAEFITGRDYGLSFFHNFYFTHLLSFSSIGLTLTLELSREILFKIFATFKICSLLFIFFAPHRKSARVTLALMLIVQASFFHSLTGVDFVSIYMIPALCLAISSWSSGSLKDETIFLSTFVAMYFYSGLRKINGPFLSGEVLSEQLPTLMRISADPLLKNSYFHLLGSWLAVFAQLGASLMAFQKTRKFAYCSSLLFHTSTALVIVWSQSLLLAGLTSAFLFLNNDRIKAWYKFLLIYILINLIFKIALAVLWQSKFQMKYWPIFDFFEIAGLFIALIALFIFMRGHATFDRVSFSWKWFLIPSFYCLLSVVLGWGEPMGYSQYSGEPRARHGVLFYSHALISQPSLPISRWDLVIRSDFHRGQLLGVFPMKNQQKELIRWACSVNPEVKFRTFTTVPIAIKHIHREVRSTLSYMKPNEDGYSPLQGCTH